MGKPFPVQSEQEFRFFLRAFLKTDSGYRYKDSSIFLEDYHVIFTKVEFTLMVSQYNNPLTKLQQYQNFKIFSEIWEEKAPVELKGMIQTSEAWKGIEIQREMN